MGQRPRTLRPRGELGQTRRTGGRQSLCRAVARHPDGARRVGPVLPLRGPRGQVRKGLGSRESHRGLLSPQEDFSASVPLTLNPGEFRGRTAGPSLSVAVEDRGWEGREFSRYGLEAVRAHDPSQACEASSRPFWPLWPGQSAFCWAQPWGVGRTPVPCQMPDASTSVVIVTALGAGVARVLLTVK